MPSDITPQPEQALAPAIDWAPLFQQATALGKDGVEVLERLQAMQESAEASAKKQAFVAAMVALRAELPPIEKTVEGQHGVTRKGGRTHGLYAPLDTITPVLDPLCAKHGFVYDFDREVIEGRDEDYMVCVVTHAAGHEKRTRYPAPKGQENRGTNALQAIAIGETYAKRYALIAAFGITTADPDEDGATPGEPSEPAEAISETQEMTLVALLDELGGDTRDRFLAAYGLEYVGALPASLFTKARDQMNQRLEERRQS